MSIFSLVPVIASAIGFSSGASVSPDPPLSAFLPPIGQTEYYRYSETVTTQKVAKSVTATLTLKSVSRNDIQVTFAVDGGTSRSLDFFIDQTGTLQPVTIPDDDPPHPSSKGDSIRDQQRALTQALFLRLALVSRIAAHSGEETSFPIQLGVAWSSGPVNPILSIRTPDPSSFVADACASTTINPPDPGAGRRGLLFPLGIGIAGAFVTGTAGSVVSVFGLAGSSLLGNHAPTGPVQTDIKLHVDGQISDGRLRNLSADQEDVMHTGKRPRHVSDKWSLVAG